MSELLPCPAPAYLVAFLGVSLQSLVLCLVIAVMVFDDLSRALSFVLRRPGLRRPADRLLAKLSTAKWHPALD